MAISNRIEEIDEEKKLRDINKMKIISQCEVYPDSAITKNPPYLHAKIGLEFELQTNNTWGVKYFLSLTPMLVRRPKNSSGTLVALDKVRVEKLLKADNGIIRQILADHAALVEETFLKTFPSKVFAGAQHNDIGKVTAAGTPGGGGYGGGRLRI